MGPRVLLVSNRLPVTAVREPEGVRLAHSVGGLATGLGDVHRQGGAPWLGWSGLSQDEEDAATVEAMRRGGYVTVPLSRAELDAYYRDFSNGVLWPILHYLTDRVPLENTGWDAYRAVNARFADAVAREARPGDTVWVHDYHLALVPGLLRALRPDLRIGFFLHVPFPAPDVWALLPWRTPLLQGLLGADLVGFHTWRYARHFITAAAEFGGGHADVDGLVHARGRTRVGAFPMGVDVGRYESLARDETVIARAREHRGGAEHVVVGIDRLDYTKGIRRRMLVVDRLLEMEPSLRGRLRFIQVATPSRQDVDAYDVYRREVDELVGRVNGRWATPSWTPIHYMHRALGAEDVTSLYVAADVMLVTPLRDGMNLVAKEFIASRVDGDGVLVLSEFAGAADELGEAVMVNPYDVMATAEALGAALVQPEEQRRAAMAAMRARVAGSDVKGWAETFTRVLQAVPQRPEPAAATTPSGLSAAVVSAARGRPIQLLLDFDGTLVPLVDNPGDVVVDAELRALLQQLAGARGVELHVVSGRPCAFLDAALAGVDAWMHAEHGWFHRAPGETAWRSPADAPRGWMPALRRVMEDYARRTTGAFVEEKAACLVWHHRRSPEHVGAHLARELRGLLRDLASNAPVEVHLGHHNVEVRVIGADKAAVVRRVSRAPDTLVVAVGDDRTDEDMFRALPADGIGVAVRESRRGARWVLGSVDEVRRVLAMLVTALTNAD